MTQEGTPYYALDLLPGRFSSRTILRAGTDRPVINPTTENVHASMNCSVKPHPPRYGMHVHRHAKCVRSVTSSSSSFASKSLQLSSSFVFPWTQSVFEKRLPFIPPLFSPFFAFVLPVIHTTTLKVAGGGNEENGGRFGDGCHEVR